LLLLLYTVSQKYKTRQILNTLYSCTSIAI